MKQDAKIFSYLNYKEYLRSEIALRSSSFTRELCENCNVHRTYISQVLNGKPHLTLEQAISIANFLGLNNFEKNYFLDLIQYNKAGTNDLRDYYKGRLLNQKNENLKLSARLKTKKEFGNDTQKVYFSSWRYAVIHTILFLEKKSGLNTSEKIASRLHIPISLVESTLKELADMGLAEVKAGHWQATNENFHLGDSSPFLGRHHSNFRSLTINRSQNYTSDDCFYSSCHTLSERSYEQLKERVMEFIEKASKELIHPSPSEVPVIFNVDLFRI